MSTDTDSPIGNSSSNEDDVVSQTAFNAAFSTAYDIAFKGSLDHKETLMVSACKAAVNAYQESGIVAGLPEKIPQKPHVEYEGRDIVKFTGDGLQVVWPCRVSCSERFFTIFCMGKSYV